MGKKRTNAFAKRQRERAKQEKRREKAEKKAQRRAEKDNGDDLPRGVDPDIAGIVPGPQPLPEEALDPELQAAAARADEDEGDEDEDED
jgi:hypothetical protein